MVFALHRGHCRVFIPLLDTSIRHTCKCYCIALSARVCVRLGCPFGAREGWNITFAGFQMMNLLRDAGRAPAKLGLGVLGSQKHTMHTFVDDTKSHCACLRSWGGDETWESCCADDSAATLPETGGRYRRAKLSTSLIFLRGYCVKSAGALSTVNEPVECTAALTDSSVCVDFESCVTPFLPWFTSLGHPCRAQPFSRSCSAVVWLVTHWRHFPASPVSRRAILWRAQ